MRWGVFFCGSAYGLDFLFFDVFQPSQLERSLIMQRVMQFI